MQGCVGGVRDYAGGAFAGAFAADAFGFGDRAVGTEVFGGDQQPFLIAVEQPEAACPVLRAASAEEEHPLSVG